MKQWNQVAESWEVIQKRWNDLSLGLVKILRPHSVVEEKKSQEDGSLTSLPIFPIGAPTTVDSPQVLMEKDELSPPTLPDAPDPSDWGPAQLPHSTLPMEMVSGVSSAASAVEKTQPEAPLDVEIFTESTVPSGWEFLFENVDLTETEPAELGLKPVGEFNMSEALGQEEIKEEIVESLLAETLEELEEVLPKIEDLLLQMSTLTPEQLRTLHTDVHNIKGSLGQTGAKRARAVLHHMETVMEEIRAGLHDPQSKQQELLKLFATLKDVVRPLQTGEWAYSGNLERVAAPAETQMPKSVKISTQIIDKMVADVAEERLLALSMFEQMSQVKNKLKELEENSQKVSRLLRDFDLQAEIQIHSRKDQFQNSGEDFDPLEFDRFTRLQEISRLMVEAMSDISEDRKDLGRLVSDYETLSAQQYRLIQTSQEELHKTRLLPADNINDRLHTDVRNSAKEVGKEIVFEMTGSRVELDRVFLEKIKAPLGHIIKNAVVHGIETPEQRRALNKPKKGTISLSFRQTSGRVIIEVSDDGYGLRVEKIRQKAIEKGLWEANQPMTSSQAADMICTPNFSTADKVSELAGRGVGMDAVRKEVLELGGRFEIKSVEGQGMTITIQLPTSVASASVLVVEAGTEVWAVPVEMVEHVVLMNRSSLKVSAENGGLQDSPIKEWNNAPFKILDSGAPPLQESTSAPVLLVKERGQIMALEVSKLVQIFEVPLRTSGTIWGKVKGVAGTVILPNGDAVFLLDPFQFSRDTLEILQEKAPSGSAQMPLVMVVDDSLTVRKATTRFLNKSGYQSIVAKDGQEALEILNRVRPAMILMDIEMPKMDGFDCVINIKQNPNWAEIPVVMITSRTADKHRQHAQEIGVNEYLGKPFKETELLSILQKYAPR